MTQLCANTYCTKKQERHNMARRCDISKKGPLFGNNISHAHNVTKKVQNPNVQKKRIFIPETNEHVRVKVSTRALRTIEKIGFLAYLRKQNLSLKQFR